MRQPGLLPQKPLDGVLGTMPAVGAAGVGANLDLGVADQLFPRSCPESDFLILGGVHAISLGLVLFLFFPTYLAHLAHLAPPGVALLGNGCATAAAHLHTEPCD